MESIMSYNDKKLKRKPSGAVINNDKDALSAYKKQKNSANRIDEMESKITVMDDKINKILELIEAYGNK